MRQHRILVDHDAPGWVGSAGPGVFHIDRASDLGFALLELLGGIDHQSSSDVVFRQLAQLLLATSEMPASLSVCVECSDGLLLLVSGDGTASITTPVGSETLSAVSVAMWSQRVVPLDTVVTSGPVPIGDNGSDIGDRTVRGGGFLLVPADRQPEYGFEASVDSVDEVSESPNEKVMGLQPEFDHVDFAVQPDSVPPDGFIEVESEEQIPTGEEEASSVEAPGEPIDVDPVEAPPETLPDQSPFGVVESLASELENFGIEEVPFTPNTDFTLDGARLLPQFDEDEHLDDGDGSSITIHGAEIFAVEPEEFPGDADEPESSGEEPGLAWHQSDVVLEAPVPAWQQSDVASDQSDVGQEQSAGNPVESPADQGDHDEVLWPPPSSQSEPLTILGLRCSCGNLNSPGWSTCRACGASLAGIKVSQGERPPLGVIRFSDGQVTKLDRSIVVGRRPLPMSHDGRRECDVIVVQDTGQAVSRNHFEISVIDWEARLIDLGSRNGTRLRSANNQELVLHKGDSRILEPGDVIRFADQSAEILRS